MMIYLGENLRSKEMNCPKCKSEKYIKNGHAMEKQRYKCKGCGCSFTQNRKHGASFELKLQALKLYLQGMGFRGIGRVLKVSNVTVLNWIRFFGKSMKNYVQTQLPDDIRQIDIIEMDEMWHFTQKKNANYGSGLQSKVTHRKSLDFQLAVGVKKPSKHF